MTAGKLQESLLSETHLDLNKAIKICKAYEVTTKYTEEMRHSMKDQAINELRFKKTKDVQETQEELQITSGTSIVVTSMSSLKPSA